MIDGDVNGGNRSTAEPVVAQPVLTQPASVPAQGATVGKKAGKKKLLLVGVFLSLFLLGGSAAAYVQFVHNSPQKIWDRAMGSMVKGVDTLSDLVRREPSMTGQIIEGSFSVSSPVFADGKFSSKSSGLNSSSEFEIGVAGVRLRADVLTISEDESTAPDLYLRAEGLSAIESLLGLAGLGDLELSLDELDDQWVSVDRTLLGELVPADSFDEESAMEFTDSLMSALKETMLSSDQDSAVLQIKSAIGKEDFEGTPAYKYEAEINKDNLLKLIERVEGVFTESTYTKDLFRSMDVGLSDVTDMFDSIGESADKIDSDKSTMDVWVESSGKYIRNIRIYDRTQGSSNYVDIGIPYSGEGDMIPVTVKMVSNEEDARGDIVMGAEMDLGSNGMKVWFNVDVEGTDGGVVAKGELNISELTEELNVQKPEDTIDIYELLGNLDLFGAPASSGGSDFFDFDLDSTELSLPIDDIEI